MIGPLKRIPRWITIDGIIFIAGLVIIGVGVFIANTRISGWDPDQIRDDTARAVDTY